ANIGQRHNPPILCSKFRFDVAAWEIPIWFSKMAGSCKTSLIVSLGVAALAVRVGLAESMYRSVNLHPKVELEEEVYSYAPANNGAGPMWCSGSTCLLRIGNDVFASGLETIAGAKPLNNCRWMLYKRDAEGWSLQQADASGRTREPCPLAGF